MYFKRTLRDGRKILQASLINKKKKKNKWIPNESKLIDFSRFLEGEKKRVQLVLDKY